MPVTAPDEGVMLAMVIVGAVLTTVTSTEEVAVEPFESVAVAVQVTVEPTLVSAAVTV